MPAAGSLFVATVESTNYDILLNKPVPLLRWALLVWSRPLSVQEYEVHVCGDLLRNFFLAFFACWQLLRVQPWRGSFFLGPGLRQPNGAFTRLFLAHFRTPALGMFSSQVGCHSGLRRCPVLWTGARNSRVARSLATIEPTSSYTESSSIVRFSTGARLALSYRLLIFHLPVDGTRIFSGDCNGCR
jgi:hypothetical protein